MDYKFGEIVRVKNKLYRVTERVDHGRRRRTWKEREVDEKALVIGKRTLNNGRIRWYSDHVEYDPVEYLEAWLVVTGMNRKPFYTTKITTP